MVVRKVERHQSRRGRRQHSLGLRLGLECHCRSDSRCGRPHRRRRVVDRRLRRVLGERIEKGRRTLVAQSTLAERQDAQLRAQRDHLTQLLNTRVAWCRHRGAGRIARKGDAADGVARNVEVQHGAISRAHRDRELAQPARRDSIPAKVELGDLEWPDENLRNLRQVLAIQPIVAQIGRQDAPDHLAYHHQVCAPLEAKGCSHVQHSSTLGIDGLKEPIERARTLDTWQPRQTKPSLHEPRSHLAEPCLGRGQVLGRGRRSSDLLAGSEAHQTHRIHLLLGVHLPRAIGIEQGGGFAERLLLLLSQSGLGLRCRRLLGCRCCQCLGFGERCRRRLGLCCRCSLCSCRRCRLGQKCLRCRRLLPCHRVHCC